MQNMTISCGACRIVVLPVLADNFVYLLCYGDSAVLVDAGDAAPVLRYCAAEGLRLHEVLLTHQHRDHTAGLEVLLKHVEHGDGPFPVRIERLVLPGHTADDVGYYLPDLQVVFTGDCLINGGCGRAGGDGLQDLFQSLQRIKQLPAETRIFGGHDYLLDNLRFAATCGVDAAAIAERVARYQASAEDGIFVTLSEEMATNPFLQAEDFVQFRSMREAKNHFV